MRVGTHLRPLSCLLTVLGLLGATSCARARTPAEDDRRQLHGTSQAESERMVAITVDDLPWFGRLAPGDTPPEANRRLLDAFSQRGIQASGFVVCNDADSQRDLLDAWLARGMDLGNHTSHHLDLHSASLSAWIDDVETCHHYLARLMGHPPRYFRYPMLHQGDYHDKRSAAAVALQRLDYTVAHVTVDNSEWLLADAYGRAVEKADVQTSERIARAYVSHLLAGIDHFDAVGRAQLGRLPPHVLLIHANALAADHIGEVLDEVRARGFRFVPLAEVLADPMFGLADTYEGAKGLSWLYRISPDAFSRWGAWDESEANRIRATFLGGQE